MNVLPASVIFLAALTIGVGVVPSSFAADRRMATRPGVADALLARSALAALDADPQLKEVNLVVSVVDRVAVIGGSVPSDDHGRRAAGIVRRVTGIADVRNRCFVQTTPDPLLRAVADRLNPEANRRPLAQGLPAMVRPPRPADYHPDGSFAPAGTALAAAPAATKSVVSLKLATDSLRRPSMLLDPVELSTQTRVAELPPQPLVPTRLSYSTTGPALPVVFPSRWAEVNRNLVDLRKSEPRFAKLAVDFRDGTVFLTGNTPRNADAWDFADAARRVPGVKRVVVGPINSR